LSHQAVKRTGCRVTSLTLSVEQKREADERIRAAGLADRIEILLCDYRSLPTPAQPYDAVVAVEMIEAVGYEFLPTFFAHCHRLLHPQHGVLVLQAITVAEPRYAAYLQNVDYIQRYVFPGSHCPSFSALMSAALDGGQAQLVLDRAENRARDYARTLKEWRLRFTASFDAMLASCPPSEAKRYDERFRRCWLWYLAYCEAGYATRTIGNMQLRFTRSANTRLLTENL
ncbi:S-adenosyl-L-methionine-dependent methyltransferase, partial [Thamnocephalis sphaerospora]